MRACRSCGKQFAARRSSHMYCSRACAWRHNGGQNRKDETWWIDSKGYVQGRVWIGEKQIRVKKHRWLMEQHLGRKLMSTEDVHHVDGNKQNNSLDNLQVIDHAAHTVLTHTGRRKARAAISKAEGK